MTIPVWQQPTIEERLVELARRHHPGATNWWREQLYRGRKALRCLVCGFVVHTWPTDRPRPRLADYLMHEHYEAHYYELMAR